MRRQFTIILFVFSITLLAVSLSIKAEEGGGLNVETANIGVMTGSTGEAYAVKNYPKAKIESYPNIMDSVAALAAGKLDAVITSDINAESVVKSNPSMIIDGGLLVEETVSVVVDKGNKELLTQFNSLIDELKADGTLEDMERRWMESDEPIYVHIPEVDGPVLNISLTATREPFSYKDSKGKIIGYAPELAYRAGEKMGRRIEFVVTDFAAMIPAVKSGKSDAIIDLLVYTEERAQSVDFSNVYYISGQVLLRNAKDTANAAQQSSLFDKLRTNLLVENRWKMLVNGIYVTMLISFLSFFLATIIGSFLCMMAMSKKRIPKIISAAYVFIIRGTPMVVLLMVMFYIVFAKSALNPLIVAVIAFGINSGSVISTVFKTAIGTVGNGQIEAARSMGFGRIETFIYIILPQAAKVAFPGYKTEFVSVFKGTAIVGYIAIVDLTKAGDFIRARTFDPFSPLIIVALIYLTAITVIILCFDAIFIAADKRARRDKLCSK